MIPSQKLPARALLNGDMVSSGEIIAGVSVGARMPRGKVEVTLERDGRCRRALWGANTIISVRREELWHQPQPLQNLDRPITPFQRESS